MLRLNLPEYCFRYRIFNGKQQIFDSFRKKYVALTAEEWVRQNFIAWLVNDKKYPAGLIAVEKELALNNMKKRYDIVVFNKNSAPAILVECKAPGIKITQKVFDQAAHYNLALNVDFLIVTNGLEHYCCAVDLKRGTYNFMEEVPGFEKLFAQYS